ncbi:putative membrane protein [Parelusimicrobium proximum]
MLSAWGCTLIVAFSSVVGKISISVVSPILLVLFGSILAFLFFTPFLVKSGGFKTLFDKRYTLKFFLIGTLGTALPFFILLTALKYTTPANVAILNQSELIYSLIFCYIFLRERPSAMQMLGSTLVLGGVVMVLFRSGMSVNLRGDLMVLSCVWMFQAGSIIAKRLPSEFDYKLISAARALYALPVVILIVIYLNSAGELVMKPSAFSFWASVFYTGFFKYGLAMIFWYFSIRALPLSKVTAIYLTYPVFTYVISVALGYDSWHGLKIAGMCLALIGGLLVNKILFKGNINDKK